jgi:hypothetical protein
MIKPKVAKRRPDGSPDWASQLRFYVTYAEKMLIDSGGVPLHFFLHHGLQPEETDGVVHDPCITTDTMARAAAPFYQMIGLAATATNAEAVVSVSVVRMAVTQDAEHPLRPSVMPRDREDRQEIMAVSLVYRDAATGENRTLHERREIVRRANGKPYGTIAIKKFQPSYQMNLRRRKNRRWHARRSPKCSSKETELSRGNRTNAT